MVSLRASFLFFMSAVTLSRALPTPEGVASESSPSGIVREAVMETLPDWALPGLNPVDRDMASSNEGQVWSTFRQCTTDQWSPSWDDVQRALNFLYDRGPFCVQKEDSGCTRMVIERGVALWICGDRGQWMYCKNASNWLHGLNPMCKRRNGQRDVASGYVAISGTENYTGLQIWAIRS